MVVMVGGAFDNARWGSRLGSKNQNQAMVARFQFCHVKRRQREVVGGGRAARMRQQQSQGGACTNARLGWGGGLKTRN